MKVRCPKCGSYNIRLAPTVPSALSECIDCKHFWRQRYRNRKTKMPLQPIEERDTVVRLCADTDCVHNLHKLGYTLCMCKFIEIMNGRCMQYRKGDDI